MAGRPSQTQRDRNRTEQARQLALGALVAIAVVFALLNFHEVKVNLIFHSTRWPLIFVIVGCVALGAAIDRLWIRYAAWRRKP
jgi:uncharacterized integral membrane protein